MSKNKTERNKIKRSLILGLLFMLCFIVASKVGAGTLHKPEAYRIVSHEVQPRAIGASYSYKLLKGVIQYVKVNGRLVIQVAKRSGEVFANLDWSLVKSAVMVGTDGKTYTVLMAVDPTEQLSGSIKKIKEIIKDEQGRILQDADGNMLAKAEVEGIDGDQLVVVKEGVEEVGLAKYAKIRAYLGDGKIKAFLTNQQLVDFENILKTANEDVLKALDEFESADEFAEIGKKYKDNPTGFADAIKNLDSFKGFVKGAGQVFKTITTDVATALNNRISHIRKIIFEAKSNGTYKFSGCHSKSAIDELGVNARIEETIARNAEGVYEAKVFAKDPTGIERIKSGNDGKSTFFPDSWSEAIILEEAEHAVRNNKGFANGIDAADGYYGFSKNGKVKIQFYYRDSDGYIGSFFPKLD